MTSSGASQRVQGECPMGCGTTLFLGEGGYVTCSYAKCPDPVAIVGLMEGAFELREAAKAMGDAIDMLDLHEAWGRLAAVLREAGARV